MLFLSNKFSSNELVNVIQNSEVFITNQHQLANHLHISDDDAKQELTIEILQNRLPYDCTIPKTQDKILNKDVGIGFQFTYARKDIERRYWKERNKVNYVDNFDDNINTIIRSDELDEERDLAVEIAERLFKANKSKKFAIYLLMYGTEETVDTFGFQHRGKQFRDKVRNLCKYAESHQDIIKGLIKTKQDQHLIDELRTLEPIINIIICNQDELVINSKMTAYLKQHSDHDGIQSLLCTVGIKYQAEVVTQFGLHKQDCYLFINAVANRINEINTIVKGE